MLLLLFLISSINHTPGGAVIVDTEYGPVEGKTLPVHNGVIEELVNVFNAVPFAKDTTGIRRFERPEPPDPWTDVYEAFSLGDACAQSQDSSLLNMTHPGWERISENCLHVNIFAPNRSGMYPVMVYIHGGSYQAGANFQMPGHFLATWGVVVVSVNYRLGHFGFSYTASEASPGNVGLWDQQMALEFVVNNIANFGGDPNKITMFGHSAGSTSVALLMLSPETKDLFQQAILQSGTEFNYWTLNPAAAEPETYTRQVAQQLGCEVDDEETMMLCLKSFAWEEIHYDTHITCSPGYSCLGMIPVVDGDEGFLPMMPSDLRAIGSVMTGPVIAGIAHDDGANGLPSFIPGIADEDCCDRAFFLDALRDIIVEDLTYGLDNVTKDKIFHAFDFTFTPWPYVEDAYANRRELVQISTDITYGVAWDRHIKEQEQLAPTYAYVYNYRSRSAIEVLPEWMGVPHIGEVPYFMGYPLLPFNEAVRNDSQIFKEIMTWTEEDVTHSIFLQEMYSNFAKYGNPTPSPVDNPQGGSTVWPQFTWDQMNVLLISNTSTDAVVQWRQKEYALFDQYLPYFK